MRALELGAFDFLTKPEGGAARKPTLPGCANAWRR